MSTIELNVTSVNSNGSRHIQLLIDSNDCGILYLTQGEYDTLNRILITGEGSGVCVYEDIEAHESL